MSDRSLPGVHDKGGSGDSGCLKIAGLVIAVPIVLIAGIFIIGSMFSDESNDDEAQSIVACESEVKANLKAPSTASFSSTASGGDGQFTVTGTVDAQNGFGATVRNSFECSVGVSGDAATARITDWR